MSDPSSLPEPIWGRAPNPARLAQLLAERYPPGDDARLEVQAHEADGALELLVHADPDLYRLRVDYLRGALDRDPWDLLVDALDNLYGEFVERERRYRELPSGTDAEWAGAFFRLTVERTVPSLDAQADALLAAAEPS